MVFRLFSRAPVVPVLRLSGAIGLNSPLKQGLSLGSVAQAIERAFSFSKAKAVAVLVNSPGGSPVQSMLIYKRIRALAEENGLPVYVFVEDVAASGGYILALAGDEIYADKSSIVGSIGVVSAMFGFNRLIDKYGIDRRVYTAGKNKVILDPFQPEKTEDVERLKKIQLDMHGVFIDLVKERRSGKIDTGHEELFSGAFWSGRGALDFGLIDGIGDVRAKMRERFGDKVKLRLIEQKRGFLSRFRGLAQLPDMSVGSAIGEGGLASDVISALEERALWARYGL